MTFLEFAEKHSNHFHCRDCGSCLLNPGLLTLQCSPFWCVNCYRRLDWALPDSVVRPWHPSYVFVEQR